MLKKNMVFEDMDFMNDDFVGTKKNEQNLKKFYSLVNYAKRFKEAAEDDVSISYSDVEKRDRNAILWIDIPSIFILDTFKQRSVFSEMMLTADDFIIAVGEADGSLRVTFGVRNVWEP